MLFCKEKRPIYRDFFTPEIAGCAASRKIGKEADSVALSLLNRVPYFLVPVIRHDRKTDKKKRSACQF